MPFIGSRLLLDEALGGRLGPEDAHLVRALLCLGPEDRVRLYRLANWKRAERAGHLAAVMCAVSVDDVPEVIDVVLSLKPASMEAYLGAAAGQLADQVAEQVVHRCEGREEPLRALTSGEETALRVLEQWRDTLSLAAFRALKGTALEDQSLEIATAVVSDIGNALTTDERRELLERLGPSERRVLAVSSLLDRRGSVDDALLIAALDLLLDHEPAHLVQLLPLLSEICRHHLAGEVRCAVYRVLACVPPSPGLVDLLAERSSSEVVAVRDAVAVAVDACVALLDEVAGEAPGTDAGMEAISLLERLRPEGAVPHARRVVATGHHADQRRLSARILGQHGDRHRDVAALKALHETEPEPAVREEAARAIRRLEVGDPAAAHEQLGELVGVESGWNELDPTDVWGQRTDAFVEALDRVARHVANRDFGSAIDQLGAEVAKILLFRAIDVAGAGIGLSSRNVAEVGANAIQYGTVLGWQQLFQNWKWLHSFASLYDMRTEHVTAAGSHEVNPERGPEDWKVALRLFAQGGRECCRILLGVV